MMAVLEGAAATAWTIAQGFAVAVAVRAVRFPVINIDVRQGKKMQLEKIDLGEISENTFNYLQALSYEESRYKDIIMAVLRETPKLDTETFKMYNGEHQEVFATRRVALAEFEQTHVRAKLPENATLVRWNIDDRTQHVFAEVRDEA